MSNKSKSNPQSSGMGMGRGQKQQGSPQKAKDFKKAMGKLLSYLKTYRLSLVVVVIFAILSSIFSIVGPKILGNATTEIYSGIMGKILGTNSAGINFNELTLKIIFSFSLLATFILDNCDIINFLNILLAPSSN